MENYFRQNLEFLKTKNGETYASIGVVADCSPNTVSYWVNKNYEPKMSELEKLSQYFEININSLLYDNLQNVHLNQNLTVRNNGENVHPNVHPDVHLIGEKGGLYQKLPIGESGRFEAPKVVTIDSSGRDNVVYVPVKARAGYLTGYSDPEYIGSLQAYCLPGLYNGTFRIFETKGVSMYPTLQDRDAVVCKYATTADFKDDRIYIIITKDDGVLVKRCLFKDTQIIAKSDNVARGDYPNLVIDMEDVLEVWYVVMRWTRYLPAVGDFYKRFSDLEAKVLLLEHGLKAT